MAKRNDQLTAIELDVLEAVACGLHNHQIAAQQFRSVETIRTHVANILGKLRARNRAHAVAIAYHIGIFGGRPQSTIDVDSDVRRPLLPPSQRPAVPTQPPTRPSAR